jgi:hypothetical protein
LRLERITPPGADCSNFNNSFANQTVAGQSGFRVAQSGAFCARAMKVQSETPSVRPFQPAAFIREIKIEAALARFVL